MPTCLYVFQHAAGYAGSILDILGEQLVDSLKGVTSYCITLTPYGMAYSPMT